jgi:gamma-glutamyltranspeptidase / glutathione hydrolase
MTIDMQRRDFLKLSGGACLTAASGPRWAPAQDASPPVRREPALLDRELLRNRNQNRSPVVCRHGIVCSSQPLASMTGVDILKAGGNAVDAAIAANAMLSLTEPMMCGPGGDLFAIVWSEKEQKLSALNASGRAPYEWTLEKAQALGLKELPALGPLSWSVPGCVSGWDLLLARHGKLSLARILEPTIAAAREGFPVAPLTASLWEVDPQKEPFLAKTFLPGGKPIEFGDIFKNPDLARVYEIVARDGAAAFYQGEIAEKIVKFSQAVGGRFSLGDFRDHKANWVEPVSTSYRGYDVWEIPPNGQGIVTLQILNLLETFDVGSLKPNSAEHLHLMIEAKKLAFEDRAVYYADMDFAKVPIQELISKDYAKARAKLIDPKRAAQQVAPGRVHSGAETTYLTVADGEGNMVSLIQSNFLHFGSRYAVDGLGFAIQNRGSLFSLNPADRNRLEPHKRPFQTIIPAFMTREGRPVFSFGCVGGDFQPQGQSQVLMNLLDFGMSVQQAAEQPRVSHDESSTPTGRKMTAGGAVTLELGIPDAVRQQLAAMGHKIQPGVSKNGIYQGIWRKNDPRRWFGGSDPRGDGCAIGY